MQNALVTLNLNDFMPRQARESFVHACARWGCEFIEITKPLGSMHHFWQKALIPLSAHVNLFDRVLQLDCDMLIRSDCPSPFAMVPDTNVGVVSRVQPGIGRGRFETRKIRWAAMMGLVPYTKERFHLNCGLVLYSTTRHRALFDVWVQAGRQCNWNAHRIRVPEQLALSCLLQSMSIPVTWLPWQFNTLRATHRKQAPPGVMETYIYHFNGPRGRNLARAVGRCQWLVPDDKQEEGDRAG